MDIRSKTHMLPQLFRRLSQFAVLSFIVYTALGSPWRNYKLAHNHPRLVALIEGDFWGFLYSLNEDFLSILGEPAEQSLQFLGFPWAARIFGLDTADPILVASHVVGTGSFQPELLVALVIPVAIALILGKVFCSHLCPMRLLFELAQGVRAGLLRLGIKLPELSSDARFGGYVLLGGLLATLGSGAAIWLLVLPYVSLSASIYLFVVGGFFSALAGIVVTWFVIDLLLAPGYFCHNLCPTGFLLENIGRRSWLRLRKRGPEPCPASCNQCQRTCPYHLLPKEQTHRPACDNCGRCVVACPSDRLVRRLTVLAAALFFVGVPLSTASAHHNKGLPHYGYYENYPQVPAEEYVIIDGKWEMGATIFNFQGLNRRDADTPNDVKIFLYLYDLKLDQGYKGPLSVELHYDGEAVSRFDRVEVDEEAVYSTRETLPYSGDYELVAFVGNERIVLPFYVELASDAVNWWLVAGIAIPAAVIFGLAYSGRRKKRRRRKRRARVPSVATLWLALVTASFTAPARAEEQMDHAHHAHHAAHKMQLKVAPSEEPSSKTKLRTSSGSAKAPAKKARRKKTSTTTPETASLNAHALHKSANPTQPQEDPHAAHQGMHAGHGSSKVEDPHAGHDMDGHDMAGHDMAGHGMKHYQTEDGAVMVMPGMPLWLLLLGVVAIIVFSFVATESIAPRLKTGFRFNLIKNRRVYKIVRSRWFQAVPQLLMIGVLLFLIYAGLFGSRVQNITPVAVWTIWWAGLIFAVLFLASAWCFICPWDGLANLASRLRLAAHVEPLSLNLRFPSWLKNLYPALFLFVVLTWLELGYGVTTNPRTTAYMGLGMVGLAVTGALLWEGKKFCAYFCPVGRICGVYSNFSPVEIRARKKRTCEVCTTEDCLHGNAAGYPCPTGISLKTVNDATMCTMCTECIKSCDKHNIAINIRPFAADLGPRITPRMDEAWFAVALLALTLFHGLSMTPFWENYAPGGFSVLKWLSVTLGTPKVLNFTLAMSIAVAIPIALYWISCQVAARWAGSQVGPRELFTQYSFALLPVALFYHLAHNLMHLLMEGGNIVPRLSDPMGSGADYFGTRSMHLGSLVSDDVLWIMQVALIIIGHIFGVVIAHRFAHRLYDDKKSAIRSLIPMTVMMILISVGGLSLMHMDMNMRMGRM